MTSFIKMESNHIQYSISIILLILITISQPVSSRSIECHFEYCDSMTEACDDVMGECVDCNSLCKYDPNRCGNLCKEYQENLRQRSVTELTTAAFVTDNIGASSMTSSTVSPTGSGMQISPVIIIICLGVFLILILLFGCLFVYFVCCRNPTEENPEDPLQDVPLQEGPLQEGPLQEGPLQDQVAANGYHALPQEESPTTVPVQEQSHGTANGYNNARPPGSGTNTSTMPRGRRVRFNPEVIEHRCHSWPSSSTSSTQSPPGPIDTSEWLRENHSWQDSRETKLKTAHPLQQPQDPGFEETELKTVQLAEQNTSEETPLKTLEQSGSQNPSGIETLDPSEQHGPSETQTKTASPSEQQNLPEEGTPSSISSESTNSLDERKKNELLLRDLFTPK